MNWVELSDKMREATMKITPFGILPDGREAHLYTITAGRYTAKITDYGATVTSFSIDGTDVVLGFDNVEGYVEHSEYMGATVGRVANRIAAGRFTLEGADYTLAINNGPNCNHGGLEGFDRKLWKPMPVGDMLRLEYVSEDMEEGFPGKLTVCEEFSLSENGTLTIKVFAKTDKTTIVNLTNHLYFNLDGQDCGHDTLKQRVKIYSDKVGQVDEYCLATGEIKDVKGTPFELDGTHTLSEMYPYTDQQIINANGIDHSYPVDGNGMRVMLTAESDESGIKLTCESDQPCVHLYTGNYIPDDRIGKGGARYGKHFGYAIEAQNLPNAINDPNAPSPILRPGEEYHHITKFTLSR